MKKATRLIEIGLPFIIGVAFFIPTFTHAQSAGIIIAEQLDQSGTSSSASIMSIFATSTDGFPNVEPTYIHLRLNLNNNGPDTWGGGGSQLVYYSDLSCSTVVGDFSIPTTVLENSNVVTDYYLDLTNPLAVASSSVKCIGVNFFFDWSGLYTANTNAAASVPFYEIGATYDIFASGSFNVITGTPTTTAAFGTNATSSAACDSIGSDPIGLVWGLCTTASYLFVPAPNILNGYANLPFLVKEKFPFSWFFGLVDTVDTLTASSSSGK